MSRDEQHRHPRVAWLNLQGELQARNIGETKVQDHQIRACEAENLAGFVGGGGCDRGVTHILQDLADMAADAWFVIDNEDKGHDQRYTGGANGGACERDCQPLLT